MIYQRKLKKKILKYFDDDGAIVVTGMRRVGKTFLLHDIFSGLKTKNAVFLDLEKLENRAVFKERSDDAVLANLESLGVKLFEKEAGRKTQKEKRAFVFLDEIQRVRELPSIIKYFSDHYYVKFVVSGSSSYYLKNLFKESLSGRKVIFNLGPLDFGEFLVFRNKHNGKFASNFSEILKMNTKMTALKCARDFEEYLSTGGFPQAVLEEDLEKRRKLWMDILESYLDIDVRSLSDFKQIDDLEHLIRVMPPRIGQKMDASKISREVGISRITAKNYLRFLKDTFVLSLVSPCSESPDREISVAPKMYFCDNGLGSVLAGVSDGQRLENAVYLQIAKQFDVNYYQRKTGAEIDFIADKKIGFEVKVFGTESDYRKVLRIGKSIGLSEVYVLSQKMTDNFSKNILPAFLMGFMG